MNEFDVGHYKMQHEKLKEDYHSIDKRLSC